MNWWENDAEVQAAPKVRLSGADGKPAEYTVTDLEKMDFPTLLGLRQSNADNDQVQQVLAPYEHKAFVKQFVKDNPFIGAPSMLFATPGYFVAKKLGFTNFLRDIGYWEKSDVKETPPSVKQMAGAYAGLVEGVGDNISGAVDDIKAAGSAVINRVMPK